MIASIMTKNDTWSCVMTYGDVLWHMVKCNELWTFQICQMCHICPICLICPIFPVCPMCPICPMCPMFPMCQNVKCVQYVYCVYLVFSSTWPITCSPVINTLWMVKRKNSGNDFWCVWCVQCVQYVQCVISKCQLTYDQVSSGQWNQTLLTIAKNPKMVGQHINFMDPEP